MERINKAIRLLLKMPDKQKIAKAGWHECGIQIYFEF